MKKRTRQDDEIENWQISIFGLKAGPGRSNKYVEDASLFDNGKEAKLELKGTDTKNSFSSSSRMGFMKIAQWKETIIGIVFTRKYGDASKNEHWFLPHDDMEEWYKEVIGKQERGHAGRAGLSAWREAKAILVSGGLCVDKIKELEKTVIFGSRLNDPKISLKYCRENGTKLDNSRLIESLREVVRRRVL